MTEGQADAFEARLDRYAELVVGVGLNLQPGQQLVTTASLDAVPLARAVTRHAYRAGASLVTTLYEDDADVLARFEHGREDSLDAAATWLFDGMAAAYAGGAARLAIRCEDPALLAGQDPARVSRANRARSEAMRPALTPISGFHVNWSLVAAPNEAWARRVFPGLEGPAAVARLWDAILTASRVDGEDPVAAWAAHNADLRARTDALNGMRYSALRFVGPGTDLTVGLADEHEWCGGSTVAQNGIACNANIPTEEVFTTPHRMRVDGRVAATKPLSYKGTLVEGIEVRFEAGRVVEARSRTGGDVLARMLDTDEGARRLGEVALVPASSPISASGILFYNTLFDENAASHVALGQSYSKCFRGGRDRSPGELAGFGANESLIHVDWMIGSPLVDVDGVIPSGDVVPVMRSGEWA